ncbi:MAG: AAA family ATPase [Anaerolineae bacterium]|nr:AAA family ATPase [Anaerolineae bacterium]
MAQIAVMAVDAGIEQTIRINRAFAPNVPVQQMSQFAGRFKEIRRMISAVTQPGAHVILFGERGVGKTSLVSILGEIFEPFDNSFAFVRVNCDNKLSFSSLWQRVLIEIRVTQQSAGMGFGPDNDKETEITAFQLRRADEIDPDDIRQLFQSVPKHPVIILDEVDRIKDHGVVSSLADTIKALSDHAVETTLILVGVADSVDELIGEHRSIERTLVQIQLPRMSSPELLEALQQRLDGARMTMTDEAKNFVVLLSKGLPYYTHLLGQHAAHCANESGRTTIVLRDVEEAIQRAIEDVQLSIRSAYVRAINTSQHDTLHKAVLLACALIDANALNELGYFSATDVKNELSELQGKLFEVSNFSRHLTDFSSSKRGNILHRIGKERQYRYRFTNPLMQPYVLMKGIEMDVIDYDKLQRLQR